MDYKAFMRPCFTDGMLLSAQDLLLMQSYSDDKRRLINRTLLGWGVVSGLKPALEGTRLILSAGFALDRAGRELMFEQERAYPLATLLAQKQICAVDWTVCLEYDEQRDGEAALLLPDPSRPGSAPARIRESSRLRAYPVGEDVGMAVPVARLHVQAQEHGAPSVVLVEEGCFYPARRAEIPAIPAVSPQTAHGELTFGEHIASVENGIYFSEEISHGLGAGRVIVTLAVLGRQNGQKCLVTGDAALFGRPVRCAAQVFTTRGTFVAAVRCMAPITQHLRLLWQAQRVEELSPQD